MFFLILNFISDRKLSETIQQCPPSRLEKHFSKELCLQGNEHGTWSILSQVKGTFTYVRWVVCSARLDNGSLQETAFNESNHIWKHPRPRNEQVADTSSGDVTSGCCIARMPDALKDEFKVNVCTVILLSNELWCKRTITLMFNVLLLADEHFEFIVICQAAAYAWSFELVHCYCRCDQCNRRQSLTSLRMWNGKPKTD